MLKYVTLGAHDIKAAGAFYDKLLATLGMKNLGSEDWGCKYGLTSDTTLIYVMKPQNGLPATFGNGTMIALEAPSRAAVDKFHAVALANGGHDEGKPGIRGGAESNWYACYVRDQAGNKLSAVYNKPV
ncbi:MAG: VOC family protein [Hyphomicrobiaceae bacterium]